MAQLLRSCPAAGKRRLGKRLPLSDIGKELERGVRLKGEADWKQHLEAKIVGESFCFPMSLGQTLGAGRTGLLGFRVGLWVLMGRVGL